MPGPNSSFETSSALVTRQSKSALASAPQEHDLPAGDTAILKENPGLMLAVPGGKS